MSEKREKRSPRGPGGGPGMGRPVEKIKDFKGTTVRLIRYLSPFKISLLFVLIFAVISTVFSIYGPKKLGDATDKLTEGVVMMAIYDGVQDVLSELPEGIELPKGTKVGELQEALEAAVGEAMQSGRMTGEQTAALQEQMQALEAPEEDDEMFQQIPQKYVDMAMDIDITGARPQIDSGAVGSILLFVLGLYVLSAFFGYGQGFLMAGITQKTMYRLRYDINDKLSRLPMKYFDGRTHGEILSRVTNDIDNISNTMQQTLTQVITAIVTIIGIIVMMLTISGWLTLVTALTLPLSAIVAMVIAKKSQKQFVNNQRETGIINGHIEEMYTGHKIIKAFGRERKATKQLDEINQRLYVAGWKSQFVSGIIMPALTFISNLGYVVVCVVGGILANNQQLTLGGIQSFITYSRQFNQPISQIANMVNLFQAAVASAERVFEVLDETEELPDDKDAITISEPLGRIAFDHVKFGYLPEKTLMKDISLQVEPGQMIAIVGPTGAGKTTLVNLLMRFYEVNGGAITFDGQNITHTGRSSLRSQFGMVLQDTWLFNGTIKENIAYSRPDATGEEIYAAAKTAYVDHFVRTLSDGYDTMINEEASNISSGQKQLLTIARALLADPAVLILDEATSSVDTRTEVLIQKAMKKLMKGRTSFVIAHRLSTIRGADLILVMNHGDIIEQGTHEELMAKDGFYADLYNSQFTVKEESA